MPCDLGLQPGICIGPLPIRFYGIIIVLGIFVGGFVAAREARYRGENPERIWDALIWIAIAGIIRSIQRASIQIFCTNRCST